MGHRVRLGPQQNQHMPPGILLGLSSSSKGIKDSNGQTAKLTQPASTTGDIAQLSSSSMFITPKKRSPRAHSRNTRTSTTDTRRPYTHRHICAFGAPLVQPAKGSISGEKGWEAV